MSLLYLIMALRYRHLSQNFKTPQHINGSNAIIRWRVSNLSIVEDQRTREDQYLSDFHESGILDGSSLGRQVQSVRQGEQASYVRGRYSLTVSAAFAIDPRSTLTRTTEDQEVARGGGRRSILINGHGGIQRVCRPPRGVRYVYRVAFTISYRDTLHPDGSTGRMEIDRSID